MIFNPILLVRTKNNHYKPLRKIPNEKRCYQLEKGDKEFKLVYTMDEKRIFAKSIVDQGIMLVSGGSNGYYVGNNIGTGEFINNEIGNNTAPRSKINLPEPITNHAFINLNQSTSFLIGGVHKLLIPPYTNSRKTYFINSNTKEWTSGPDLKYGRVNHAAGTLIDHTTKKQHIAVVAGWETGWANEGTTNSVELLLHGDNEWTQGILINYFCSIYIYIYTVFKYRPD